MFCKHCGMENDRASRFCVGCGKELVNVSLAQQTAVQRKKKNAAAWVMSAVSLVLAAALVLSLLGVFGGSGAGAAFVSKDFAEPDDVIEYYVECLKNMDYEGALKACAVCEMAAGFDFEERIERLKAIDSIFSSRLMPSEYEEYAYWNELNIAGEYVFRMMHSIASLSVLSGISEYDITDTENVAVKFLTDAQPIIQPDRDMITGLIKDLQPVDLTDLEILEIEEHERRKDDSIKDVEQNRLKCMMRMTWNTG